MGNVGLPTQICSFAGPTGVTYLFDATQVEVHAGPQGEETRRRPF